jgi:hypothetical protein
MYIDFNLENSLSEKTLDTWFDISLAHNTSTNGSQLNIDQVLNGI